MDLVEEKREDSYAKIIAYKQRITRYHNRRVRPKAFNMGDLVLRKAEIGTGNARVGKLMPNWKGPYEVAKVLGASTYKLQNLDGLDIPRSWNAEVLKKYTM